MKTDITGTEAGMKRKKSEPGLESFFPRARQYASLVNAPKTLLREPRDSSFAFPYTERYLQCIWFDSLLRPEKLATSSGEQVIIQSPGTWNLEAGPDFLDAVLIIGPERRVLRGDVEIHIHPSSWKHHHHSDNKNYSRLIAHVSYFPSQLPDGLLPKGSVQISLRDALNSHPGFSFENVDVTAYPYLALTSRTTPCARLLKSWNPSDMALLLESAGEERLKSKAFRMESPIRNRGEDQILYEEIMASLGYKHNSAAFRQLAAKVPLKILRDECQGDILKGYSILAGVSGLLPVEIPQRWHDETRSFVRQLWDNWWKARSKWEARCMKPGSWRLSGLRPQNLPLRRLAAAASIFAAEDALPARLTEMNITDFKSWHRNIQLLFKTARPLSYWDRQLSFSAPQRPSDIALVGVERIASIESNVLLPFLTTRGLSIRKLISNLPPEQDNSLIRLAASNLFGRDHNPSLYHHGLRQQGLIQIFHDFCLTNRSACSNCTFPETLKSFGI